MRTLHALSLRVFAIPMNDEGLSLLQQRAFRVGLNTSQETCTGKIMGFAGGTENTFECADSFQLWGRPSYKYKSDPYSPREIVAKGYSEASGCQYFYGYGSFCVSKDPLPEKWIGSEAAQGAYPLRDIDRYKDTNYMTLTCDPSCGGYVDPTEWHNYIRRFHVASVLKMRDGKGRERRQVNWQGSRGPIKNNLVNSGFRWGEQGAFPSWHTTRGDMAQFFKCNYDVEDYNTNYPGHPGEVYYGRPYDRFPTNGVVRDDNFKWSPGSARSLKWGGLKGPGSKLLAQAFAINGHVVTYMPQSWMNWAGHTPQTKGQTPEHNARAADRSIFYYDDNKGNTTSAYFIRVDDECWTPNAKAGASGLAGKKLLTVDCDTGVYTGKKEARWPNYGGRQPDEDGFYGRGDPLTDDGELLLCTGNAGPKNVAVWYNGEMPHATEEMINCQGFCICNKDYSIVIGHWSEGIRHSLVKDIVDFQAPGLFVNKYPGGWDKDDPYDGFALLPKETLFNAKERTYLFDQLCFTDGGGGYGIANYRPKPSEHVCKHYESEDACPSPRCSWDGDACADPPCSSHTSEDDCCGDCEWEAGQCQPAMFKACPKEGTPGSNVCPEGCTFVDNCEQCEFAAGVWKKKFSTAPWKPSTGSRPQGCFRNRKFNIKCNKFQPGSKYPSGKDKVGEKRGKWPICKIIEPPKECKAKGGLGGSGSGAPGEIGPAGGLAAKTVGKCGVGGTFGFSCDSPTAAVYCNNPRFRSQVEECCPGKC